MRYIRTTDGRIIDITDITCFKSQGNRGRYVNDDLTKKDNLDKWLKYNNTYIIKQADTIEELSDELVVKYKNEEKPRCINMSELLRTCKDIGVTFKYHMKWLITTYKDQLEICKLAIWTDKGLIYVTESMNDKGEPVLL